MGEISNFQISAVEELFHLISGLEGDIYAQLLEEVFVHAGENDAGMSLAAAELIKLIHCLLCHGIGDGAYTQRNKDLVGVEAGVAVAHMLGFQVLDRLDNIGRNEKSFLFETAQLLKSVEEAGGGGAQQGACLAGDYASVGQLKSHGGIFCLFRAGHGGGWIGRPHVRM